jgi:hypothetical protein
MRASSTASLTIRPSSSSFGRLGKRGSCEARSAAVFNISIVVAIVHSWQRASSRQLHCLRLHKALRVPRQNSSACSAAHFSRAHQPESTAPRTSPVWKCTTSWSNGHIRLGARCDSCHAEDPKMAAPDGHPRLKFADDSKPMKAAARLMYRMTEEINAILHREGRRLRHSCHLRYLPSRPR